MLKALIICSALAVACVSAVSVADCKCREGMEAQETAEGARCVGILTKIITPCNLPVYPRCVCTGDATASVNSVAEGSYCEQREKGVRIKRWECENTEEWIEYRKNNPQ